MFFHNFSTLDFPRNSHASTIECVPRLQIAMKDCLTNRFTPHHSPFLAFLPSSIAFFRSSFTSPIPPHNRKLFLHNPQYLHSRVKRHFRVSVSPPHMSASLEPRNTSSDIDAHPPSPAPNCKPSLASSTSKSHLIREKPLPNKWLVVVAASLVHALHATAVYMGPATLLSPMRSSLHLSVAEISLPLNVYRAIQGVFLIPSGFILDAIGPQLSLRLAITAAAFLAPFLPFVTSLTHLIILQSLFSVTKLFGGLSALLLITAGAFAGSPGIGTASSILLSGYSFAGFLAPAVIGSLSERFGWRFAFSVLSATFIIVALPLTFHFLREVPDHNTLPRQSLYKQAKHAFRRLLKKEPIRGDVKDTVNHFQTHTRSSSSDSMSLSSATSADNLRSPEPTVISRASASSSSRSLDDHTVNLDPRNPNAPRRQVNEDRCNEKDNEPLFSGPFLTIAAAVAAFSCTMNIVFDHLLVFLNEDFGLPFQKATYFVSALNLIALFSKLSIGPVSDRLNKSLLIGVFGVIGALGSLALFDFSGLTFTVTSSLSKIITFIILYSISYASIYSLTTSILPEFGKSKLGVRSNFNLMLLYSTGSLGSLASGILRSNTGTYKWPFVLNVVCFLVASLAGFAKYFLFDTKGSKMLEREVSKQK